MLEKDKLVYYSYALLVAAGAVVYMCWSLVYGTWKDMGLITLSLLMVLFGIVGISLYGRKAVVQ